MEEIIAKSKMYKAIKAKQREDDEEELDKVRLCTRSCYCFVCVASLCTLSDLVCPPWSALPYPFSPAFCVSTVLIMMQLKHSCWGV
jgi:hypothetical protein